MKLKGDGNQGDGNGKPWPEIFSIGFWSNQAHLSG
jgi:hypothetical protein